MNGPEHYREAERLLDEVLGNVTNPMITYAEDAAQLAAAQVHATLALTAATVQEAVSLYTGASEDLETWARAIDAAVSE